MRWLLEEAGPLGQTEESMPQFQPLCVPHLAVSLPFVICGMPSSVCFPLMIHVAGTLRIASHQHTMRRWRKSTDASP